jgi:hypothetical protein
MDAKLKAWEISHIEICGTFHSAEDEFIDKLVGIKHFSATLNIIHKIGIRAPLHLSSATINSMAI